MQIQYRRLCDADAKALVQFLRLSETTTLFLQNNLHLTGVTYQGLDFQGEYVGAFKETKLCAVVVHYWNGMMMGHARDLDFLHQLCEQSMQLFHRPVAGIIGETRVVRAIESAFAINTAAKSMDSDDDLFELPLDQCLALPALPYQWTVAPAHKTDFELLVKWVKNYNIEALGSADTAELDQTIRADVMRSNTNRNRWVLSVAGEPLALAGLNAQLPHMVQIGPVWTPMEHRKRGYASMLLSSMLQQAYARQVQTAILFTNNPVAAKVYITLGFKVVGTFTLCFFKEAIALCPKALRSQPCTTL